MRTVWLSLLLIACLPAAGRANLKDGPFIGYALGGDVEDPGLALGWQAAHDFTAHLSLEFSGSWQEDKTALLIDQISGTPGSPTVGMDVIAFALTGRAGFLPHPSVRVYGGAGAGYYLLKPDNEEVRITAAEYQTGLIDFVELDVGNEFGWHLAGGSEVRLTRKWEAFAEFRYVFLEPKISLTASGPGLPEPQYEDTRFSYNHGLIRIGLNYRF